MSRKFIAERYLKDVVPFLPLDESWKTTIVTGLAVDSRKIQKGNCFVAYPGHHSDGRDFLAAALHSGAESALVEATGFDDSQNFAVPVVKVPDLKSRLGEIASAFYGNPSSQLKLLAITGTNGKTSVSQLVAQALDYLGSACGVIGTLGNGLVGELEPTSNTTPDIVECNRVLHEMLQRGARCVTMETSSHGLVQGRVDGLSIFGALVTNISRDHLDYHGTMEEYTRAKSLLVSHPGLEHLVLNLDDERVAAMSRDRQPQCALWTFSLQNRDDATVTATKVHFDQDGISLQVRYADQTATIQSSLIGEFNGANLLAGLTLLMSTGIPLSQAAAAMSVAQPVAGRMQRGPSAAGQPMVVIDFAHTPDALEKVLLSLRRHVPGRIWCVFGCGGDRDAGKRPLMAEVVADLADEVVITADNPRSESFGRIVAQMVKGVPEKVAFQVIEDRSAAVAHAISNAEADDVVLIAGKGHENYQEIRGVKHPYSDLSAATKALLETPGNDDARGED